MITSQYSPKLAAYWFVADGDQQSRLASYSWPFELDRGPALKTIPQTHEEVWPAIQRLDSSLASYSFDHFPRGRLEYYPPTRRWMIAVDEQLDRHVFIAHLCQTWSLLLGRTTVTVDPGYRSRTRVAAPA